MSSDPVEYFPVQLTGANGADLLMAVQAVVAAQPGNVSHGLLIQALGGDDAIVRDRTGSYGGTNKQHSNATVDGGSGFDVLSYNGADTAITARLDQIDGSGFARISSPNVAIGWENNWFRGADRVKNVEGVAGSVFGDRLHGDGEANRLWGHDGDDTVVGNGGHDSLWGGEGDDYVSGGDGNDRIEGNDGEDSLYGGQGADSILGGDGDDVIWGQQGADTLRGGDGSDSIRGGDDNDSISTGDGSDTVTGDGGHDRITIEGFGDKSVDGGSGVDTIVFSQKLVLNLYNNIGWRGESGVDGEDAISNVENVISGNAADVVIGTDAANDIRTSGGADWVMAMGGADTVLGGSGGDTVYGGDGADSLRGEDGADSLDGGADADVIWGGHGQDTIRGGAGADQLWGNQPLGLASQIPVKDVFLWAAGDIGLDTVHNFSLQYDRLQFGQGFLAAGPRADNLLVFNDGGNAMLAANIAGVGWDFIARFESVNAIALANAIESGAVFDVQTSVLGGGGPGGFGALDPAEPLGVGLQIMF